MNTYFKHTKLGAIYAELSKELGIKPFFVIKHCNSETIIHMPYMNIIITPRAALHDEKRSIKHEHKDKQAPPHPKGASKN